MFCDRIVYRLLAGEQLIRCPGGIFQTEGNNLLSSKAGAETQFTSELLNQVGILEINP